MLGGLQGSFWSCARGLISCWDESGKEKILAAGKARKRRGAVGLVKHLASCGGEIPVPERITSTRFVEHQTGTETVPSLAGGTPALQETGSSGLRHHLLLLVDRVFLRSGTPGRQYGWEFGASRRARPSVD
jgi:hypothetical protein